MKTLIVLWFVTSGALIAQQTEPIRPVQSAAAVGAGVAPSNPVVLGRVILGAQMAGGPPVTGSPYSAQAEIDMTQALADGNRIELHSSSMRYRDAQGRERREEVLSRAMGTSTVFISDPVARTSYTLDQKTHTAQKIGPLPPLPPRPPAHGGSLGVFSAPPVEQADILKARGLDHGAFVRGPVKGSPAEKAGIRSGDIILAVDGQSVKDSDDLGPLILAIPVGNSVTLNLDREGKKMDTKVALQDRAQVFADMPGALGGPQAIVYPPFVQVPPVDRSTTRTEDLGTMTLEGILAEGKRSTMTIPAGQVGNKQPMEVVSETWYSPDLQTMILIKHSDPRTGNTVYRLTNINRTEPLPSLFQVPSDYSVTQAPMPNLIPAK
jgi:membrane-associated protease RseP (regulator of RpoE activity)